MRHLEQHSQKKYSTKIIIIILFIIGFLYFLFSVGFKLLLSTSAFIAGITNRKVENIKTKPNEEYSSVSIDSIPSATNSAKIMVSGSVVNFNELSFYINGEMVKEISLPSSDNFSEEIGDLNREVNEVFVKAKQKNNNFEKNSKINTVLYKKNNPKLEISEPQDGTTFSKNDVLIKGSTDKETYIKINDLPMVVDANGNFQTTLFLNDGENKISLRAEDIAGNIETKELKLIFRKDD